MKTKSFIARRAFIGRLRPFISRAAAFIARRATCLVRAGFKPAPYCLLLLATAPAFAQADLTVCAGQGFMITSKADAQSISGGVTYTWHESTDGGGNYEVVKGQTAASLPVPLGKSAGTYAYVRYAAGDACPGGVSTKPYTVLVKPAPAVEFVSPPAELYANSKVVLTVNDRNSVASSYCFTCECTDCVNTDAPCQCYSECVYTPANTYSLCLPNAGTLTVRAKAITQYGCVDSVATTIITVERGTSPGTYTHCTAPALVLTGVGFASSATYLRNNIILSAPVTVTTCQKTTYGGGTVSAFNADCRTNPSYNGDLFSWCMVKQYAAQLCPSPWRVPSTDDICTYTGQSSGCSEKADTICTGLDGWSLCGACLANGTLVNAEYAGYYWTITNKDAYSSWDFGPSSTAFFPAWYNPTSSGNALRCVQDAQ